MRFNAEHRFSAPPPQIAAVLADPDFYGDMQLPDLGLPEVVEHRRDDDGSAVLVLRYEYVGHLDPIARRLLGHERLRWLQELHLDHGESGTLAFRAEANPGLLHGEASFVLSAEGSGTVRCLEGELLLALPGIGGMAERRIVPGLLARLDLEADAINRRLADPAA